MDNVLPRKFYRRPPQKAAPDLLGKILVRESKDGEIVKVRISETEAYGDERDSGSHARFGKTQRSKLMFETVGYAYVYLIYGIYDMLNITCHDEDIAGAVLIRGAGKFDGPGKLTRELNITVAEHHGVDITTREKLWLEDDGFTASPKDIKTTPRVGIDYAEPKHLNKLWRFVLVR